MRGIEHRLVVDLGAQDIGDDGTGRRRLGTRKTTETVDGRRLEETGEAARCARRVEKVASDRGDRRARLAPEALELLFFEQALGQHDLARIDAGDGGRQGLAAAFADTEL